jgi:hypothetical protein
MSPSTSEALDVLDVDLPDGAERATPDHRAGVADQRVAGVVEGDAEDPAARLHPGDQVLRVGERGRERLVADHVQAGLERVAGGRVVLGVRGHDRERVDAVAARALAGDQLGVVAVGPVGRDAEVQRRRARALPVAAEHCRHHLIVVVQAGGRAVHRADERARPAADHAQAQPPPEMLDGPVHRGSPCLLPGARFGGCELWHRPL